MKKLFILFSAMTVLSGCRMDEKTLEALLETVNSKTVVNDNYDQGEECVTQSFEGFAYDLKFYNNKEAAKLKHILDNTDTIDVKLVRSKYQEGKCKGIRSENRNVPSKLEDTVCFEGSYDEWGERPKPVSIEFNGRKLLVNIEYATNTADLHLSIFLSMEEVFQV